jgi:hypothetical protein
VKVRETLKLSVRGPVVWPQLRIVVQVRTPVIWSLPAVKLGPAKAAEPVIAAPAVL